jgi:hypothetical protein
VLNPDGTWRYTDTPASLKSFTKPESARSSVNGKVGFYTLWLDDAKWSTSKEKLNKDAEFEFAHVGGDRYAYVIAERIEIPRSTMKKSILARIKSKDRNARVTLDESRRVNYTELSCRELETTLEGVHWKALIYFWSGRQGSLQMYGYTGRDIFDEFRADLTDLLNGLVVEQR